jgi:hypothetical protein
LSIEDIEEGRALLSIIRAYKRYKLSLKTSEASSSEEDEYVDDDFLDELKKME